MATRIRGYRGLVQAAPQPASRPLLEVALNGSRTDDEHPAIPRTPAKQAEAARASVAAGAGAVHVHVYDESGAETLDAEASAAVIEAIRGACPGVPISLSTSAEIEPDPERRRALIAAWTALPELVTANQGEPGIRELCDDLLERGVGIEAGHLVAADAEAAAIEAILDRAGIRLEQVHHGDGIASWAVNRRAIPRGHGIRTGLEDTTVLPDGASAADNAELVRAAAAIATTVDE